MLSLPTPPSTDAEPLPVLIVSFFLVPRIDAPSAAFVILTGPVKADASNSLTPLATVSALPVGVNPSLKDTFVRSSS